MGRVVALDPAMARCRWIGTRTLRRALDEDEPPMIVDVRGLREFFARPLRHIPGAINIPLSCLDRCARQAPITGAKRVVLVADTREHAAHAARVLESMGFRSVHVLACGLREWPAREIPPARPAFSTEPS